MKPTQSYSPELLANDDKFGDAFFSRFELRHAPQPLQLDDKISKNYLFPTFYGDVTCSMAIFLCSYKKAAALLPHDSIKPVRMPRGRAIVAFSTYVYRNVKNVPPYNEIAMTIPVMVKPLVNVPVLPMVLSSMPGFGYYVFSMPVTSLENKIRGRKIWGLPKVVEQIDIDEKDGISKTVAFDAGSGKPYFELNVPATGKQTHFDVSSNLYSVLDDRLLKSATSFKGDFAVTKNMGALFSRGELYRDPAADDAVLKLGSGGMSDTLRSLELEAAPFQTRFCRSMNSCFDLADASYNSKLAGFRG